MTKHNSPDRSSVPNCAHPVQLFLSVQNALTPYICGAHTLLSYLQGALTAAEAPAATPVSCDIYARLIIDVHTAAKPSGQGNRTSTGGSSSLSSMQSCSRPSSASSSTCASPATSPSKSHNLSLSPQAYGEQPCAAGGSQRPASQGSESANLRRYLLNCLQASVLCTVNRLLYIWGLFVMARCLRRT